MAYKIVTPGIAESILYAENDRTETGSSQGSFLKLYITGPILELSTSYFLLVT